MAFMILITGMREQSQNKKTKKKKTKKDPSWAWMRAFVPRMYNVLLRIRDKFISVALVEEPR